MIWGINKLDSFRICISVIVTGLLILVTYFSLIIYICDNELSGLYRAKSELQFNQLGALNDWGRGISGQIRDLMRNNTADYFYLSDFINRKIDETAGLNSKIYDLDIVITIKNDECNTKSKINSLLIVFAFILQLIVVISSLMVFLRRRNQQPP